MLVIMIKGNSFLQLKYTMLMLKFKIKEKNQVFMNTSDFVFEINLTVVLIRSGQVNIIYKARYAILVYKNKSLNFNM